MRARIASCVALFLVPAVTCLGCEGVPDLTFAGGGEDATAPNPSSLTDSSTSTGADDSAGQSVPDEGITPIPIIDDDSGSTAPHDAAPPPPPTNEAGPPQTGCPNKPPQGVTCCGAVACKGSPQQCNCGECAYCANEGYCCPSSFPPPGYCANTLSACK
ncbi:MAG: hypothetical protein ACLQVI_42600 [Polyangiaceae bacterium]